MNDKSFLILSVIGIAVICGLGIYFRKMSPIGLHHRIKVLEAKVAELEKTTEQNQ